MFLLPRNIAPFIPGVTSPYGQDAPTEEPQPPVRRSILGTRPATSQPIVQPDPQSQPAQPVPTRPRSILGDRRPTTSVGDLMPDDAPIPDAQPQPAPQPLARPGILGTRPSAPVYGDAPASQPANTMPVPSAIDDSAPYPTGGTLQMTDQRNTIGATPMQKTPDQSTSILGVRGQKVVRGEQAPVGSQPQTPLDPWQQATQDIGPEKKLTGWGRVKGALLGAGLALANSGGETGGASAIGRALGGAAGGGLGLGRDQAYKQQINNRAGQILQQRQYQQQKDLDTARLALTQAQAGNIKTDNDLALSKFNEQVKVEEDKHKERLRGYDQKDKEHAAREQRLDKLDKYNEKRDQVNTYIQMLGKPGVAPEVQKDIVGKLNELGYQIPADYNSSRGDQLSFQVDKTTGDSYIVNLKTGSTTKPQLTSPDGTTSPLKLTPKPANPRMVSESELTKQAYNNVYTQFSQAHPNGMPDPEGQAKLQAFAKRYDADPNDPEIIARFNKKFPNVHLTVPIEKSQEFKTAQAAEVGKLRKGSSQGSQAQPTQNSGQASTSIVPGKLTESQRQAVDTKYISAWQQAQSPEDKAKLEAAYYRLTGEHLGTTPTN